MKLRSMKYLTPLLLSVAVWGQGNQNSQSDQGACTAFIRTDGSVVSAELVSPPLTVTERYGPKEQWKSFTVSSPFCRVIGLLKPEPASEIHFELWLPLRANWNGKFEGVGAGGSVGAILYRGLLRGLARNYAVAATDNGHVSADTSDVSWASGHPERVKDFGYRAEHSVTEAAKELTQQFYGRAPKHSYFVGCSQGGHHGMTEAQRFPKDYDGIIAGAPVYSWTAEMVDQAWNARALGRIPAGALPKDKIELLAKSVTTACAGPDGVIAESRLCSFDPSSLLCGPANQSQCLGASEVEAVRQMYDGPRTSAGVQISPGLARGSESTWDSLWSNPEHLGGSWKGVFRYMVFEDPTWDLAKLNFDRDPEFARVKLGSTLNPDDPDLSRFADSGGKIIVYHGSADQMVPSESSIHYYDSVLRKLGPARADSFYRLFMIPGMAHCGGGPGADFLFQSEIAPDIPLDPDRDLLTALEHWVENGEAPKRFVASRVEGGKTTRTRLVCPYPSAARYGGAGDPQKAEMWGCSK